MDAVGGEQSEQEKKTPRRTVAGEGVHLAGIDPFKIASKVAIPRLQWFEHPFLAVVLGGHEGHPLAAHDEDNGLPAVNHHPELG